ncbi:Pimeloyl-(acyl-carrier protein) methyl ester esterase [Gammaproteobacteria bacterium]
MGAKTVVLLHGWGFHGGIWEDFAHPLRETGREVHIVNLPGHGSAPMSDPSLEGFVSHVQESVPTGAMWVGWSLGGVVAMSAAASSGTVGALTLIGTSPRFTIGAGWPHAMAPERLTELETSIQQEWHSAWSRFLILQLRGLDNTTVRRLRTEMLAYPPSQDALTAGLQILRNTDLRSQLSKITCPVSVVLGGKDPLVPVEISVDLSKLCPHWKISCLPSAGHLPFLTHPAEVLSQIVVYNLSST